MDKVSIIAPGDKWKGQVIKLPVKLMQAINTYYYNRDHQSILPAGWNKQADLKAIREAAPKFCFTASAGTFVFERNLKKHVEIIVVDDNIHPKGRRELRKFKEYLAEGV